MRDSTKVFWLLALLLLLIFPFAGLAPLMFIVVAGIFGMILQLVGAIVLGDSSATNDTKSG
ncbi:MAG: hypothetical protein AAF152_21565 [Cyanobacteria bacterium P01_A01_bin.114]